MDGHLKTVRTKKMLFFQNLKFKTVNFQKFSEFLRDSIFLALIFGYGKIKDIFGAWSSYKNMVCMLRDYFQI